MRPNVVLQSGIGGVSTPVIGLSETVAVMRNGSYVGRLRGGFDCRRAVPFSSTLLKLKRKDSWKIFPFFSTFGRKYLLIGDKTGVKFVEILFERFFFLKNIELSSWNDVCKL